MESQLCTRTKSVVKLITFLWFVTFLQTREVIGQSTFSLGIARSHNWYKYEEYFSSPWQRPTDGWYDHHGEIGITSLNASYQAKGFLFEYSIGSTFQSYGPMEKFPSIGKQALYAGYNLFSIIDKDFPYVGLHVGPQISRANFRAPGSVYIGGRIRLNVFWFVLNVSRSFDISNKPRPTNLWPVREQLYNSISVGLSIPIWRSKKNTTVD